MNHFHIVSFHPWSPRVPRLPDHSLVVIIEGVNHHDHVSIAQVTNRLPADFAIDNPVLHHGIERIVEQCDGQFEVNACLRTFAAFFRSFHSKRTNTAYTNMYIQNRSRMQLYLTPVIDHQSSHPSPDIPTFSFPIHLYMSNNNLLTNDAPIEHAPTEHGHTVPSSHDQINPKIASDIHYWAEHFKVTGQILHEAIRVHGTHVSTVRHALEARQVSL